MPAARAIARRIAQNAPLVGASASSAWCAQGWTCRSRRALETEHYVFGLLRDTEDRIEGRRAFQEKRTPVYRGR